MNRGSRGAEAPLLHRIKPNRILLDPGLGFAKTAIHNWQLLGRLEELVALGHPVLVGASRKSFLGDLLGGRAPVPPAARDAATAATSALAAAAGAFCVRVHDVATSLDAVRVADAWTAASVPTTDEPLVLIATAPERAGRNS
jgi:dihydropteroate synthase